MSSRAMTIGNPEQKRNQKPREGQNEGDGHPVGRTLAGPGLGHEELKPPGQQSLGNQPIQEGLIGLLKPLARPLQLRPAQCPLGKGFEAATDLFAPGGHDYKNVEEAGDQQKEADEQKDQDRGRAHPMTSR